LKTYNIPALEGSEEWPTLLHSGVKNHERFLCLTKNTDHLQRVRLPFRQGAPFVHADLTCISGGKAELRRHELEKRKIRDWIGSATGGAFAPSPDARCSRHTAFCRRLCVCD
jgi:hypothetical protein